MAAILSRPQWVNNGVAAVLHLAINLYVLTQLLHADECD